MSSIRNNLSRHVSFCYRRAICAKLGFKTCILKYQMFHITIIQSMRDLPNFPPFPRFRLELWAQVENEETAENILYREFEQVRP